GLMIKEGDANRTLRSGDLYQDGWVLTGLTPEVATLSKAGQARQVGLNPDSAIAQRDVTAASQITTIGAPKVDPAVIDALLQRMTATGQTIPGMDAAASQQMMAAARDYMATPAGQAAVAQAYQQAIAQYGQGTIDRFMAQPPGAAGAGGAQRGAPAGQ
ncbi:MAG: hypothetical protein JWM33_2682, partial [Caulobacteraceae bacterium]|nr:hypothetical protein [Caulobacteraceae bacterium]